MPKQPSTTRNIIDRLLLRWANHDPQGKTRRSLLFTTAFRKLLSGDPDAAARYIYACLPRWSPRNSKTTLEFPEQAYLTKLLEEEKKQYLQSAVKLIQYSFPRWDDGLCVVEPAGDELAELEEAGYSDCEGLHVTDEASKEKLPRRVRRVASLQEAGCSYRTVAVFNLLEHLHPSEAEVAIDQLSKLAEEYIVASIAVYPDQLLDFFDKDSGRKTLRSRHWWDELFSRYGVEALEPPHEILPHVTPFIYRRRRLARYTAEMREFANGAQSALADSSEETETVSAVAKAVFILPNTQDSFYSVSKLLARQLRAEMFASRLASPRELGDPGVAKAPFKLTRASFQPEYRRIQIGSGRQLEFFVTNFQLQPRGTPSSWLCELRDRPSIKLVPSTYCREALIAIGIPEDDIQVVPFGYSPEFSVEEISALPLATHKSFRLLAVVNSDDPFRFGADLLLKAYRSEFKADDDVCLVIKDYGTHPGAIQPSLTSEGGPEVLFYSNFISKDELASLYVACSAMVAPFRGEGFGVKILDAAALGLPLILPLYGGPADYCPKHLVQHVSYKTCPVENSLEATQGRWKEELTWCEPDVGDLGEQMRWVFEHQQDARQRAAALRDRILQEFSWKWAGRKLIRIMQG